MSKAMHILQQHQDSDLVLVENITPENKQTLHLFLRYHDGRMNYSLSFETHSQHVMIDGSVYQI